MFRFFVSLLAAAPLVCLNFSQPQVVAAPVPIQLRQEEEETVKDRGNFIPKRQYPALKGKAVGVLVGNPLDALGAQEGGSGSADALVFGMAGGCYRWVYVPVKDNPAINNLDVRVGEKGDEKKVFTSLDMANAKTTKQWGVDGLYVLVEIEVNDNLGAPKCDENQGFVATKMRQLDGTKEFPLKVAEVVVDLRKRYKKHLADQEKTIAAVLARAGKDALKDAKPTGPKQQEETMYVTWLPDKDCLVVRFRTTITDGAYTIAGTNIHHETGRVGSRVGTSFGIEFGRGYEVSKTGKTTRVFKLPIQSFTKKVGLPVGTGRLPSLILGDGNEKKPVTSPLCGREVCRGGVVELPGRAALREMRDE